MTFPLAHPRVLEIASEIAGPYAGKLFADAGSDVVKVETPQGDPLRRHTANGSVPVREAALLQYLNTSKRSVVGAVDSAELLALAAAADGVIVDATTSDSALEKLRAANPHSVVVSITSYSRSGPWAACRWRQEAAAVNGSAGPTLP